MSKPFDATLNTMIDSAPEDWALFLARRLRVPLGPVEVLDTDLSTTLQPDKVFKISGSQPAIIHLELESSSRRGIPAELLRYNAILHEQYRLPTHSVLVLLRPKANASDLTGTLNLTGADGEEYLRFQYQVVRVWKEKAGTFLKAAPNLLPLAMLTDEAASNPEATLHAMEVQLRQQGTSQAQRVDVWGSTFMLCGLRYNTQQTANLFRSLSMTLEDSSTYQMVLHKGKLEERLATLRSVVLRLGTRKFGKPKAKVSKHLNAIVDVAELERLTDELLEATNWDELLATD